MNKYIVISDCQKVLITTTAKNIDNAFNIANEWRATSGNINKIERFNECQVFGLKELELASKYVQLIVNI